jgi:surface protein
VPKIIGNPTELTTKLSNKGVEVNYENGSEIVINNTQTTVTKNITIKNNTANPVDYLITFEDVINNITDSEKFSYSYSCSGIGCKNKNNVKVPKMSEVISYKIEISSNLEHAIQINLTYDGVPAGNFSARVNILQTNTIIATSETNSNYFWGNRENIVEITFKDVINTPQGVVSWDVSNDQDESIIAYIEEIDQEPGTYHLYIQSNGLISANENSSYLFFNFEKLNKINNIDILDTSSVTDMSSMFRRCMLLSNIDFSRFDTSLVTSTFRMFEGCSSLSVLDVSGFDMSSVVNMQSMFNSCNNLTSINLTGINISNVTNMSYIFSGCHSLTSLDLTHLDTSNVVEMGGMFYGCINLTNIDLRKTSFTSVYIHTYMFYNITSGINIIVKDTASQTFIKNRLSEVGKTGNVTIYVP